MSQKKRSTTHIPAEVCAVEVNLAPNLGQNGNPRDETLGLLEMARARLRVTAGFGFTEADVTKRLLIALLETLTPEQRAEVRRRLGA